MANTPTTVPYSNEPKSGLARKLNVGLINASCYESIDLFAADGTLISQGILSPFNFNPNQPAPVVPGATPQVDPNAAAKATLKSAIEAAVAAYRAAAV